MPHTISVDHYSRNGSGMRPACVPLVPPIQGPHSKTSGVTINDQEVRVPVEPDPKSPTHTVHVPWVLRPLYLLSSPTGSCGEKSPPNGEFMVANQLPVNGAA